MTAPAVDVVIATHHRPELLRVALDAVLGQTYTGHVRVTLVFDQSEPDHSLARSDGNREVVVKIEKILNEMDVSSPQVALSTVIGELTLNNNEEFGLDWFARGGEKARHGWCTRPCHAVRDEKPLPDHPAGHPG